MKPITLKGKKWLGLKSFDVTFDQPLSIVQGENGTGKTSLADAFRYLLGAPVRTVPVKENAVLGHCGDPFSLNLGLNGHELKASKSSRPKVAEIESIVGVSRKAIDFCVNSDRMLEANPKELKDLLAEVLQLDFDWRAECIKRGCDEQKVKVLPKEPKKAIKDASDRRAECKEVEVEEPDDEEVAVRGGMARLSEVPLDAIEASIAQKEEEYEKVVGRHASILDSSLSGDEKTEAEKELEELKERMESMPDVADEKAKLSEVRKEKEGLQRDHNGLKLRQAEIVSACKKIDEILEVKLCDKCRKLVVSRMAKGKGQDEGIETKMGKIVERVADLTKEEGKLGEKIGSADGFAEIPPRIRELEGLLENRVGVDGLEKLKGQIHELQGRLDVGRALRDKIRDYRNALYAHKQAASHAIAAKEEWAAWDKIVKAIPEAEKEGVAAGLEPLREVIATHKVLDGTIEISDDLDIVYEGRPVILMSDSERYRISLVLYFAILELFKFPFVLVDRGDLVVTKSFKDQLLMDLVAIAAKKPVIFLQARADEETKAGAKKTVSGIGFYHVAGQTVKRLGG